MLKGFVSEPFQAPTEAVSSFLSIPGFQSYAPQSGQIFGILTQMEEDFTKTLKEAQAAELTAQEQFTALKAAKVEEITAAEKAIAAMDEEIAATDQAHAQALEEYEDTMHQLDLDRQFLADLKKKCTEADAEFAARVKSRTEEIAAVEDTIAILNTDESFDTATATVNKPPVFLQAASAESQATRMRMRQASAVLRAAARKSGNA